MINVIKCCVDYIDIEIDKYYNRFNYQPYIICSQDTFNVLSDCCKIDYVSFTQQNVGQQYKGCYILIDNNLQFGMIDIR